MADGSAPLATKAVPFVRSGPYNKSGSTIQSGEEGIASLERGEFNRGTGGLRQGWTKNQWVGQPELPCKPRRILFPYSGEGREIE
jgi:hypothetical protein